MIVLKRVLATSLLDFIACALGAGIVLMMVSATVVPRDGAPSGRPSLVLRTVRKAGAAQAELGIQYRPPGSRVWRTRFDGQSLFYSAPSHSESGGEAFLVIPNPEPGRWDFRPYLRDYPRVATGSIREEPVQAKVRLVSGEFANSREVENALMMVPGDAGPTISVTVRR